MEKEKLNKKQIIPLVIGVLTMIILVSSATYAYFRVSIGNTATSTTITGDIGGGTLGTITLDGGGTNLYLGVSAYDMSENKKGTTYYSSTTEGSRETNLANAGKTTYTATLSGDESNSVMYACDYEFTVTVSGSMLGKSYGPQLIFEGDINKTLYFSNSSNTTQKVSGTFRKITSENPTKEFNAYLQFTNTNSTQNSLAGTSLSVEIENTKWNCYLLDDSDLVGDAYAIYTESDRTLTFVRSETPIVVGDTYNDVEITQVYTDFEDWPVSNPPWQAVNNNLKNVIIKDKIKPISTSYWFSNIGWTSAAGSTYSINIDVSNLDTSLVTNMSEMFKGVGMTMADNVVNVIGLDKFNTKNVTNMSNMFSSRIKFSPNIANWDVSNVTNMSGMFNGFNNLVYDLDLSDWDVSKVTDMSYMFSTAKLDNIGDISNWQTVNVTNMSSMFNYVNTSDDFYLDLRGWDVKNIANYTKFNDSVSGNGTLIPPTWPTTN